jgi:hypothetical protein
VTYVRGQNVRRLIAVPLLVLIAACAGPAPTLEPSTPGPLSPAPVVESPLPSASTQASASPAPSLAPTPPGVGTLDVFLPGAAVQVAVKELNLRKNPSTSAKRVELLSRGDVLIVSPLDNISFGYGPVKKGGFTWYPVMVTPYKDGALPTLPAGPLDITTGPTGPPPSGWVASDDGEHQYLTALQPRCPITIDLASVQGMLPAERLGCFGAPIVLEGTYGCGGCGGTLIGIFKPNWLVSPLSFGFLSVNASERLGPMALRFPPSGPTEPAAGSIIRVTVHVDDSRATKCIITEADETGAATRPVDSRTAVLLCREQLVVESLEVLGADPSFPLG